MINIGTIGSLSVDAAAVLDYFALDPEMSIFSVGHAERRVTMHTQQLRSLNLAAALIAGRQVTRSSRVAIIGGGLAGVTLATALTTVGASIRLIERTGSLMNVQAGCHTRYIHPNVFDWPMPHAFASATTLPFLNWRAGTADSVTRQVMSAFESFRPLVDIQTSRSVIARIGRDRVISTAPTFAADPALETEQFDVIILAVGFGVEKSLLGIPVQSYWHDESLHQVDRQAERQRRLGVIGAGDGGVTDVLRLVLRGFDHGELLGVGHHPDVLALGSDMASIEETARLRGPSAGAFLEAEYAHLVIPPVLQKVLHLALRDDVSVTLFEVSGSPFQLSASIMNRMLLLAALRQDRVRFRPRGLAESDIGDLDLILPRIGPKDALKPLMSDDLELPTHDLRLSAMLAGSQICASTFFRQNTPARTRMRVGLVHNAADRHNRDLVDRIRVDVREHNQSGRGAFISLDEARIDAAHMQTDVLSALAAFGEGGLDVIIIPNSDIALHAELFVPLARRMILCCEAMTLQAVEEALTRRLGPENLLLVPQVLDLQFMIRAIKLGFAGLRLCYIHHPSFPVDALYIHVLREGLKDVADGLGGVELVEHVCNAEDFSAVPKADLYTGRHFVHASAPRDFIGSVPYLSGYASDMERGALAALDINDDESGRRLVRGDLLPLALGYAPPERVIRISDMSLGLNLAQARRFGIEIPESFRSLATVLLEE